MCCTGLHLGLLADRRVTQPFAPPIKRGGATHDTFWRSEDLYELVRSKPISEQIIASAAVLGWTFKAPQTEEEPRSVAMSPGGRKHRSTDASTSKAKRLSKR